MEQKTNVLKENLDIEIPERECHRTKSKEGGSLFFLFFRSQGTPPTLLFIYVFVGIYLLYNVVKQQWQNWAICRAVDGPRFCHTEWSRSEREKQMLYINAYMWNLEKWCRWNYFQGKNNRYSARGYLFFRGKEMSQEDQNRTYSTLNSPCGRQNVACPEMSVS